MKSLVEKFSKLHNNFSMYKIILHLPLLPKSLNAALRAHYHARSRNNQYWDQLIATIVSRQKPEKPLEHAQITLIRHSYKTLDYDGLVGSMKPVVDALVSAGVLIDDSWKVLGTWHVDQKFRSKKDGPMLEIQIMELPI